jgi:hypothetical protein
MGKHKQKAPDATTSVTRQEEPRRVYFRGLSAAEGITGDVPVTASSAQSQIPIVPTNSAITTGPAASSSGYLTELSASEGVARETPKKDSVEPQQKPPRPFVVNLGHQTTIVLVEHREHFSGLPASEDRVTQREEERLVEPPVMVPATLLNLTAFFIRNHKGIVQFNEAVEGNKLPLPCEDLVEKMSKLKIGIQS